jgi:hypothetical protein
MNIGAACQFRLKDKIAAPLKQMVALESLELVLQAPPTASGRSPIRTSNRK